MTLSEWLTDSRETQAAFAARPEIAVHPITVTKWTTGRAVPRAAKMQAIELVTGGKVRPNDFYGEQRRGTAPEADVRLAAGTATPPGIAA
jgi:DNA-binding transcriptional regulator YdaS (Cro superfamily)